MTPKLEREREALRMAEIDLENRRKQLADLEREEAEKKLSKLMKKLGADAALEILELSVSMKASAAISARKNASAKAVPAV